MLKQTEEQERDRQTEEHQSRQSDKLLDDIFKREVKMKFSDFYTCQGKNCWTICHIMKIRLGPASKRLCTECYHEMWREMQDRYYKLF